MEVHDRTEVGVAQRVPVQREEGLAHLARGEGDPAGRPERLVLDAVAELEVAVARSEVLPDLGRQVSAGDDSATDAVAAEMLEGKGEERTVDERQHVLADAIGQRAEARPLPSDQNDRGQAH